MEIQITDRNLTMDDAIWTSTDIGKLNARGTFLRLDFNWGAHATYDYATASRLSRLGPSKFLSGVSC